jgi:regulator of nucleoside diphosphate kinase
MHSRVRLKDLDSGKENVYTLVFPAEADIAQSRISVLAPLGTALLGYRQGDVIRWRVPGGWRRWKVKEVLDQPAGRATGSAVSAIQASSLRRSRATVREAA